MWLQAPNQFSGHISAAPIWARLGGTLNPLKSDPGRDQPSSINTSCVAIRAPASSTRGRQLESGPNKPPQSPGAFPLLPLGLFPGRSHPWAHSLLAPSPLKGHPAGVGVQGGQGTEACSAHPKLSGRQHRTLQGWVRRSPHCQ